MIAERLRSLRRELNITKRELVTSLPLNYSTYANYESGFREPNSEVLQVLAAHFGVSLDYLMGVSDHRMRVEEVSALTEAEHKHITRYRKLDAHGRELVDVVLDKEYERSAAFMAITDGAHDQDQVMLNVYLQSTSAGLGCYGDSDYETMQFMATPISKQADFCVKITGESMEPKICDGDIVFVKAVPRVDIDSVGIFVYEGEVSCKRLRHKKGTLYLESLNNAYASKIVTNPEELRAVGLVIGIAEKV